MKDSPTELSVDERLLIGRLMFDGASPEQLADRFGTSKNCIDDAWHFCRTTLSEHFAKEDDAQYRLYSIDELRERGTDSLRLLLDWRQAVIDKKRTVSFANSTAVENSQVGPEESP